MASVLIYTFFSKLDADNARCSSCNAKCKAGQQATEKKAEYVKTICRLKPHTDCMTFSRCAVHTTQLCLVVASLEVFVLFILHDRSATGLYTLHDWRLETRKRICFHCFIHSFQSWTRGRQEPSRFSLCLFIIYLLFVRLLPGRVVAAFLLLLRVTSASATTPVSALIGCSYFTSLRPDWISNMLDIQSESATHSRAVGDGERLELFTLNDPGSPSGRLTPPDLGEESRRPVGERKIV